LPLATVGECQQKREDTDWSLPAVSVCAGGCSARWRTYSEIYLS
jgi:hypothetical protein